MKARYKGEIVTVIRLAGRRSLIVWRGCLRRVNARELEVIG